MQPGKVFGVVPSENGRYVMVALSKGAPERSRMWVRRWDIGDKLQTLKLLQRGVYCGIPSFWKSALSRTPQNILSVDGYDTSFTPWADGMIASIHSEGLSDNLLGLVPEDSYLCTLPLYFGDNAPPSFIAVHGVSAVHDHPPYFKIGIVLDKKLIAVFAFSPGVGNVLESHVARIRRSFIRAYPQRTFPEHVFLLGLDPSFVMDHFSVHPLSVKVGGATVRGSDELKALGCALVGRDAVLPVFSGSSSAGGRRFRARLWLASAMIILGTMLAACAPAVVNYFLAKKILSYETQERLSTFNNPDIRAVMARNERLGASIFRLNAKSKDQTQWAVFLRSLGNLRPEGLYFEKLGSEVAAASAKAVRIAISGSARNETMVTDMISRLQKSGLISNISLSSLEKNKTQTSLCDFKFICTLKVLNP
jgi:Tfp pilus assembly protein PilN